MSRRANSLIATVKPELENKAQQTLERIKADLDVDRKEIISSLKSVLKNGLEKVAAAQPGKGKIKHIHISYLLSSLLAGKCEFRIDFYNSTQYLDEMETESYWVADFITDCFVEDFKYFQTLLKAKLVRVRDYEARKTVVDFGMFYLSALTFCWQGIFVGLPFGEHAHLFEKQVKIVYGGFQDKSVPIALVNVQGGA